MQVLEGKGWRLDHDPARHPFVVLIGGGCEHGAGWAVELSAAEATALAAGVGRLVAQHAALADALMDEESIDLELERPCGDGVLWLALGGDRRGWALRFVLTPGPGQRGVEGGWDAAASAPLAAALAALVLAPPPATGADSG